MADATSTHHPKADRPKGRVPSRLKLGYDIVLMVLISIDLLLISIDAILMSGFTHNVAAWLGATDGLLWYQSVVHDPLRVAGGFFTLFLIAELLLRWAIAIYQKLYYRWFFFPFVHWYEVLGCFPQLRALRLFRAVIIGRRLYQLGYQVLPQPWLNRMKFYIDLLLEELSDRVVLTTIHNFRAQLTDPVSQQHLIDTTFDKNREHIKAMVLSMLRQELAPQLQALAADAKTDNLLAHDVGYAIQQGLTSSPELRRYLRMIPIAGSLIESQLVTIGQSIGENVAAALTQRLLEPARLDSLMVAIADGIADINTDNQALEVLVASIVTDSLATLEAQVRVQQWKHQDELNL